MINTNRPRYMDFHMIFGIGELGFDGSKPGPIGTLKLSLGFPNFFSDFLKKIIRKVVNNFFRFSAKSPAHFLLQGNPTNLSAI